MEIVNFILERLRVFLKTYEQLPHDCIEAVLAHEEAQECNTNLLYQHARDLAEEIREGNPSRKFSTACTPSYALPNPPPISPPPLLAPLPNSFDTTEEKNLHARINPSQTKHGKT